jgi:SAM-dependent methyltransferase
MGRDMVHDADSSPTARLLALWDHLGIRVAHVATQMPGDIAGLAARFASRLGGVVLCVPSRLDTPRFETVADRLLMICGERGLTADVTGRAAARLRGATRRVLAGYDAPGWADVVADRTDEIAREVSDFLGRLNADAPASPSREGTHAGISYRVVGSGPALVLLPFFLAPSQWAPAVAQLARTFTVVTLGGPHLGGVAALEDRARAPTYQAMFRTLIDLMVPAPGEAILDVGCGAGSLDRLLARRLGPASAITAIDVNPFLLSEAAALARAEGFDGRIRFAPGNAQALPFDDESLHLFDHGARGVRRRPRAGRDGARGKAGWPGGRRRAIDRLAAMVERRRGRNAFGQDGDAAAIGRREGSGRRQPLSPRPAGRARRSHLLSVPGDPRPARWANLALSRGPSAGAVDRRGSNGVARRARRGK